MDYIAEEIADYFTSEYSRYTNLLNGHFKPRMSGVTSILYFPKILGVSADGRKIGDFLFNNAVPNAKRAIEGPTTVVKSLTKFAGGAIMTMKFSPKFFRTPIEKDTLKSLIKTYFKRADYNFNLILWIAKFLLMLRANQKNIKT